MGNGELLKYLYVKHRFITTETFLSGAWSQAAHPQFGITSAPATKSPQLTFKVTSTKEATLTAKPNYKKCKKKPQTKTNNKWQSLPEAKRNQQNYKM